MAQAEQMAADATAIDVDVVLVEVIDNLEGSFDKLEDAAAGRYGQTWERAGQDVRQVLPYLIRRLREVREAVSPHEA